MPLVNLNNMLADAREKKYAVPAFDVSNYEMIRAVAEVCREERSPAIFMCLKPDLEGAGLGYLASMVKHTAEVFDIPVCLHLDHATDFEDIKAACNAGFSSVMYDGSKLPLAVNAANTAEVVKYAHDLGISVEAELGHVCDAIAGTSETGGVSDSDEDIEDCLTKPEDVVEFIGLTGVDCLAVAVGTAHGVYTKPPLLRLDLLELINVSSPVPLVLHGGSVTPDDQIQKAISLGITKINIYSEVLTALNTGLKHKLTKPTGLGI